MLLGTAQRHNRMNHKLTVLYGNDVINAVAQYKYLGTQLNNSLNITENFDSSYRKSTSRLRLLQKIRPYLTVKATQTIYQAMIVPIITYSSMINLRLTQTQRNKLASIDRRARSIIGCETTCSLEGLIMKQSCILVRKCLDGNTCINFRDYFQKMNHDKNTRNVNNCLRLPVIRTEYARRSFSFMASKYYNELPLDCRMDFDFPAFVRKVSTHFQ